MKTIAELSICHDTAASDLFRIEAALAEAQCDVGLLERLKGAEERVTRLYAERDTATARQV